MAGQMDKIRVDLTDFLTTPDSRMRSLWKPGAVVAAVSPLRVDLCGMTDFIPAEGWCVNSTLSGLTARMRMVARRDNVVNVDAGSYGEAAFTLADVDSSNEMFMKALDIHRYADYFGFGMDVKVNCEFGAIGLSSSSSVASLYNAAMCLICGEPYDPLDVARKTQAIEPHWYGRQDQLAVAYGGFNLWHMTPGKVKDGVVTDFGQVERFPINLPTGLRENLPADCFLIYHSGIEEGASGVLSSVVDNYGKDPGVNDAFDALNSLAQQVYLVLNRPNVCIKWLQELGRIFDEIRHAHERLHPSVTNKRMQDLFKAAKKAGALGGRYSGAGGRGALIFICRPGETARVSAALDTVSTPFISPDGKEFNKGRQIHFTGFGSACAAARFSV